MPEVKNVSAFTVKNEGLTNRLKNNVTVCNGDLCCEAIALWDTGATSSCISKQVADALNLPITGYQHIRTPSGESTVNTYMVNIILPNNVLISDVRVCGTEIGNQGIGVLIGMDIISLGDFSVSTFNGETWFSFRTPSVKHTDYVEQIKFQKTIGPTHGKGIRKHKK